MKRRKFLAAAAGTPFMLAPGASVLAQASPWPAKPITMVAAYAPGNSGDTSARLIAHRMGSTLGQQIVIDNKPGAGGVGAVKQVAAAAPDGYTLLAAGAVLPITQSLFKPPPYDLLRDFAPVSAILGNDVLLMVRNDSKHKSLADFIQDAGKRREAVMVGVSQLGTSQHMCAELFKARTGVGFTVVPYKSTAALGNPLLAGDVDVVFELTNSSVPIRQTGKVRSLAISAANRNETLPDVPTMQEQGVAGVEVSSWGMVFAPAKTPDGIVQRLSTEIQKALQHPDSLKVIQGLGSRVMAGSPAQARELVANELVRWQKLVAVANIALR